MATLNDPHFWTAPPGEGHGIHRLLWILRRYPVAPLELMAALSVVVIGLMRVDGVVSVVAIGFALIQVVACLYEWQKVRLIVAAALFGYTIWILTTGVWVNLGIPFAELWIVFRSVPLRTPRRPHGG